jgi:hypothetical protein
VERLLELIQLCPRPSVIPQLLVMRQHFQQSGRKVGELFPLVKADPLNLLADQGINCEHQATILVSPFFELG